MDASLLDLTSIRTLFPHIRHGIYFNHAAISPLSKPVVSAIQGYLHERHETDIENYANTLIPTITELRIRAAKLLNAETRNIAFIPNTSYGLNLLAQGLNWKEGDRILLYEGEFPSNIYPFLNLRQKGVSVDYVNDVGGELLLSEIEKKITPKTKLVSLSYVQYLTGYRLNLHELASLCHKKNVFLSVDAIQGFCALPINCKSDKIDFLSSGGHKWAMSPMGTGIAYISDELLKLLSPVFVGWLSVEDAWHFHEHHQIETRRIKSDATRYEIGTYNWLGLIGMNAAFRLFENIGQEKITHQILTLSGYLNSALIESGFDLLSPSNKEHQSGIITINHLEYPERIFKELEKRRVEVSLRGNVIRLSPHFYNTMDECDLFLHEFNEIVETMKKSPNR